MTQDAGYTIKFHPHRNDLRVEVSGLGTLANTMAYWLDILAQLRRQPAENLLLVDETTGDPLTSADWKALVEGLGGQGLETVRIAHVKPHGLQQIEYCEIFAREAGLDARVFADEVQADLWLRHGLR